MPFTAKGFASVANDHIEAPLDLHRLLVRHPAATFVMRARGNGLSPEVRDGDLLVVDRSLEPREEALVVAVEHGELAVRHFRKPDGPTPSEDAPDDGTPDFQVWGVVSFVVRDLCMP